MKSLFFRLKLKWYILIIQIEMYLLIFRGRRFRDKNDVDSYLYKRLNELLNKKGDFNGKEKE